MNDCGQGVINYIDFTGDVEIFEVRLNDDGSNPKCIYNLEKVCLALTITCYVSLALLETDLFFRFE